MTLDPGLVVAHASLATGLFRARRFPEAEREARRAVGLNPNYARAHYVLAISLLLQQKSGKEALTNLRQCFDEVPQARRLAAIGSHAGRRRQVS